MSLKRELHRYRAGWAGWRRLGVALAGALAATLAPAATLTLAIADLPHMAPALVAEAEGYFAAEGLDLKLLHCVNGRRCLQHLIDGQAQLATVADVPMTLAAHAGARFDIVATLATAHDHRLVARADRGIKRVADLKGKRVGFVRGTSVNYFIDTLLLLNDIAPAQVQLVALEPAELVERLVRGDLDAAAMYQPLVNQARQRLGANATLPASARVYTASINLVSAHHPQPVRDEDLTKLLRALRRACDLIDSKPAQAQALLARKLDIDLASLRAIWPDFDFRLTLQQPMLTTLESQSRWAARAGLVPAGPPPDFLTQVRPEPLRSLDPRAVTLVR